MDPIERRLKEAEGIKKTRQQKRAESRRAKKYDNRQTFTKEELEEMNAASYEYGKRFALEAARKTLGLGEKRLARVNEELARIKYQHFVKPFE